MPELVIRNIDENVLNRLTAQAERNKHTLEDEVRNILAQATRLSMEEFGRKAAEIREGLKHIQHTDNVKLIREDRDR